MEIFGKKGLGSYLKILLQIVFGLGILILLLFPLVIRFSNLSINPNIVILYPNAICLLLIVFQFIGLFDSLKINNPFCYNTVKRLKTSQKIAIISASFWILDFSFEVFVVKSINILLIIAFGFMAILFIGVAIAFYLLSELFNRAIEFKNENDLTI